MKNIELLQNNGVDIESSIQLLGSMEFYNETLTDIGKKYNKSAAQVALRYLLDMGVSIVVKSTHEERMRENLDVLDFFLSDEEKEKIHELNENTSVFFDHYDPETVEYLTR